MRQCNTCKLDFRLDFLAECTRCHEPVCAADQADGLCGPCREHPIEPTVLSEQPQEMAA